MNTPLLGLDESGVTESDEPGLMLLTIDPEQLVVAAGLVRRASRTPSLALDAEHACHSGHLLLARDELVAEGRRACQVLSAQADFAALCQVRRNGSPRQTWDRFRLQARQLFPGLREAQSELIVALAIRVNVTNRAALAAHDDEGQSQ